MPVKVAGWGGGWQRDNETLVSGFYTGSRILKPNFKTFILKHVMKKINQFKLTIHLSA